MMSSVYPLWWLALPVLLLPIWWHRQKRRRLKAEPLATARFLPSAPPEQQRIWRWRDQLLLLVRCLMLVALIAWLAAAIFPWRGDTVLIDSGADGAWAEQQIAAAGFSAATRLPLPPDALTWLHRHERDWRADAKLLIVARANEIAMPARVPQFSHHVELRTAPARTAGSVATAQHVALAADEARMPAWRALFAAFESAGDRHLIGAAPTAASNEAASATRLGPNTVTQSTVASTPTALIVWDRPAAPPDDWRAPHWWIGASAAASLPDLAKATTLTINGIKLKYADGPRGRLWTSDAFPPLDADTAQALYEAWRLLAAAPAPAYATPSLTLPAAGGAPPAAAEATRTQWLAICLAVLFMLERILTHARRN